MERAFRRIRVRSKSSNPVPPAYRPASFSPKPAPAQAKRILEWTKRCLSSHASVPIPSETNILEAELPADANHWTGNKDIFDTIATEDQWQSWLEEDLQRTIEESLQADGRIREF